MKRLLVACFLVACSSPGPGPAPLDGGVDVVEGCDAADPACEGDPCAADPCPDAERCNAVDDTFECLCPAGSERDADGECVVLTTCEEGTCDGHGTCRDEGGVIECTCDEGHAGPRCGECDVAGGYGRNAEGECVTDLCDPNPCDEAGRTRCVSTDGMTSCECDAGTHDEGGMCVPDTTCTETTCNMRGTCTETPDGVACECIAGSAGVACDECDIDGGFHDDGAGGCTMDACLPNPCVGDLETVCTDVEGEAICSCDEGAHRDGDVCVIDEVCEMDTCADTGTCAVREGLAVCDCDEGHAGPRCEMCADGYHEDGMGGCTTDVCLPDRCDVPNQSCVDRGGVATCECDAGYHDDGIGGCTMDVCLPDPCAAMNQACRDNGGVAECYVPDCDDGNECTTDELVGGVCVYTPLADGSTCSTSICQSGQTCQAGTCGGGAAVACDDANACTDDSCHPIDGCAYVADDTNVPDDGIDCTVDVCSMGAASHTPSDGLCSDGLFCNGAEVCAPGNASADAMGCMDGAVPAPPGPSTPCRSYGVCDEGSDSFPLTTLGAGQMCNDGLSCTTGDVCDAAGICRGTAMDTCTGACSSTTPLGGVVDVPVARLDGAITIAGGALPAIFNRSGVTFTLYLRDRHTGQRHSIANPGYYGVSPNYTLANERVDAALLPGVYDLLYSRGHDDGSESSWPRVGRADADSVFANGYTVLREGVVLGAGTQTLDVDVPMTRLGGTITSGGAPLPAIFNRSGVTFTLYLVDKRTGQRHSIANPGYYGVSPNYTLANDTVDAAIVPGTYDLIYSRGHDDGSASSWPRVGRADADSVFVNGYTVLQEDIVIAGGNQTLNVDVPMTRLGGTITSGGAPLPAIFNRSGVTFTLYLLDKRTGQRHSIANPGYYGVSPNYTLANDTVDAAIVPGTYDLIYSRGHDDGSASSWPRVGRADADSVFVNGYTVLQEDIVIAGGAQTLNVDVPMTRLGGSITSGGAPLPAIFNRSGVTFTLYLLDKRTGQRHSIANPGYYGVSPNYTLANDMVDAAIVPGTYDLIYSRGHDDGSDSSWPRVGRADADSVFVNGYTVLQEDVVIAGGNQTLNVDVPMTRLGGTITSGGAPLPAIFNRSGVTFTLYLLDKRTGQRHSIANPGYYGVSPNYTLANDTVDAAIVPGTYDLIYSRGHDDGSASSWPRVGRADADSVFVNGYTVLQEDIVIAGGTQTLNVDVPVARLFQPISLEGLTLPAIFNRSGVTFTLYLVDRRTEQRHSAANPGYYGVSPNYTLANDTVDAAIVPGTYDLIYSRGHDDGSASSWPRVGRADADSVFPSGYAPLGTCIAIP